MFQFTAKQGPLADFLVMKGALEEWDAEDRSAIEAALAKYFRQRIDDEDDD
jgi:hypothetical protein